MNITSNTTYLTPAKCVIVAFGSASAVARILGCQATTISKWIHRGSGNVPCEAQKKLILEAKRRGVHIDPIHLILGRYE